MELILTILVGAVGGAIGKRCRIPGGVMVGAMIAVTVFNVITGKAYVTHDERAFAQMIAGAFSGCMITRGDLRRMPKLAGPALWILGLFLLVALTIGGVLLRITSMSRITCYMALVPGSAVNTPIIAADYGADVVYRRWDIPVYDPLVREKNGVPTRGKRRRNRWANVPKQAHGADGGKCQHDFGGGTALRPGW